MGVCIDKTGIFKPSPPFSSLNTIYNHTFVFASIGGVFSTSRSLLQYVRKGKNDIFNDILGAIVVYKYAKYFLFVNERRMIIHNRCVGTVFGSSLIYIGIKSCFFLFDFIFLRCICAFYIYFSP